MIIVLDSSGYSASTKQWLRKQAGTEQALPVPSLAVEPETRWRRAVRQLIPAELERDLKKRRTRREMFPGRWTARSCGSVLRDASSRSKAGSGRRPHPLGAMPRVHCVRLPATGQSRHGRYACEVEAVRHLSVAADGFASGRDDDPELPPPAGAARAGQDAVRGGHRAPGLARASAEDRDDLGHEHHCGTVFDEEPPGSASARRAGIRRWTSRSRLLQNTLLWPWTCRTEGLQPLVMAFD